MMQDRKQRVALRKCLAAFLLCGLSSLAVSADDASDASEPASLKEMSLEDLMNIDIEVTSVSKTAEKGREAAAAIYVVTQEDIRRSGATNIPEALRMVPGISVAQLDANKWAVTSRGFNDRHANKLLVLVDGRTVYTPLFTGVHWATQDIVLQDVERIEVIRGPGGTLWGANAVNGVINIITKSAKDTQGGLLSAGAGSEERGFGALRYGGALSEDTYYRVYAKYFDRDDGKFVDGETGVDDWASGRLGFRLDSELSPGDQLTVLGDAYNGKEGQRFVEPSLIPPFNRDKDVDTDASGGDLLARWNHTLSDVSDISLQVYYDLTQRHLPESAQDHDTYDIDFQHHRAFGERHDVVWGLGFREVVHRAKNSEKIRENPRVRNDELYSVFAQDQIAFLDDRLHLTLGTKLEYNDYTGAEVQPSARLAWTPNDAHTVWASISRAVRVPSRIESDASIVSKAYPFTLAKITGNDDMDSETLWAEELGYRVVLSKRLTVDIAVFHNDYDELRTLDVGRPFVELWPLPPHLVLPLVTGNNMTAESYGAEAAVAWQALPWWQWTASYAFLDMDIEIDSPTVDFVSQEAEGATPQHQAALESRVNVAEHVELDARFRYVGELESIAVDDYCELDVRLGWQPKDWLEIALAGRNLLDSKHLEFAPTYINTVPTEVQRSVYGEVTWRF